MAGLNLLFAQGTVTSTGRSTIYDRNNIDPENINSECINYNTGIKSGFAGNTPMEPGNDYNSYQVTSGTFWSSAVQTNLAGWPNAGRIWVASTLYKNGSADSLRIYYSDNNGITWNYAYFVTTLFNSDFRPGELDLELVYDGSTVWLYGVAGYTDFFVNRTYSLYFRFNTSTNSVYSANLLWPGNTTATNKYYNPRITSDNSVYTSNAYVLISCSADSTIDATTHKVGAKFCKITAPYSATPVIDYSMPSAGYFYYSPTIDPNSNTNYLWSDIAYSKAGSTDRIFISSNLKNLSSVNVAWSDNYGSTLASNTQFTFGTPLNYTKMAFNGGQNNGTGMIIYNYLGNAPDWDAGYIYTTNAGANWSNSVLDNSPNRIRSIDIQAVRGVNNSFKIAYSMDSASSTYGIYVGGSHASWNLPVKTRITPGGIDTSFTKIIAGYKSTVTDNCLAVYSNGPGNNIYVSGDCQSTVGINGNNNQVPGEFKLEQNYPNPFNPQTTIKFSIPKSSYVKLVIYDSAGKEVNTLASSVLEAGNYSLDFNASGLASGIYFCRLEADGFLDMKKMVLIK
jgi:hypothetical protein